MEPYHGLNQPELDSAAGPTQADSAGSEEAAPQESSITGEIGILEDNVNALSKIAQVVFDLREKIRHGAVGKQCKSDAQEAPNPFDMKSKLSVANQSIRIANEQIHKILVDIEKLLGV